MPDCNLQLAQEDLEDQDVPKERKIKGCVGRYYYMGPPFFCFYLLGCGMSIHGI